MFQLRADGPHGVVGPEHDPLRAVGADDVPGRVGVELIERRRRVDDDVVVLRQHLQCVFPDTPAPEVRSDEFQFREGLQHVLHAVRVRIVVAFVAGVDINGQALVLTHGEDLHGPGLVDLEALDVRVQLDAVEPEVQHLLEVCLHVLRVEVQGAESREPSRMGLFGSRDVGVDAVDLVRCRRDGEDDVVFHSVRVAALHEPVQRAVIGVEG